MLMRFDDQKQKLVFGQNFGFFGSNKLASLGATLVRNYDPLTHSLTDRGKV